MISPDATRFLVLTGHSAHRLYDEEGRELAVFPLVAGSPARPSFDRAGRRFLGAFSGNTATIYDRDGVVRFELAGHLAPIRGLSWSRDGEMALTFSDDRTARLWSSRGEPLAVLGGHRDVIAGASFGPRGNGVVTWCADGVVRFFDLTGQLTGRFAVPGNEARRLRDIAFLRPGDRLLVGSGGGILRIIEAERFEAEVFAERVTAAVWNLDGTEVVTGHADGSIRFHLADGEELERVEVHRGAVTCLAFAPDGRQLVTTSFDGTAVLWSEERASLAVFRGHDEPVVSGSFSADGLRVLTASADGTARSWDPKTGEFVEFAGHEGPLNGAAYFPGEDRVVTWSVDGTVRRWDPDGRCLETLLVDAPVLSVQFMPEAGRLLTLDEQGGAKLWDWKTGLLKGYGAAVDRFTAIAASRTTGDMAFGLSDGSLSGARRTHGGAIRSIAWSKSGTLLATTSDDWTARVVDQDRREIALLEGHTAPVLSASFSPDGKRLLTRSEDGTARVWLLRGEDLLKAAKTRLSRDFTAGEREEFGELLGD